MKYKGKDYTSQEILDLLENTEKELSEIKEKQVSLSDDQADSSDADENQQNDSGSTEEKSQGENAESKESSEEKEESIQHSEKSEEGKKLTESESEKKVKTLSEKVVNLLEERRKDKIEIKLNEYADKGVPPSMIDVARKYMEADKGAPKYFKLSENGKEESYSLSEAISALLGAVEGVSFSEDSDSVGEGSSDLKDSTPKMYDEIRKYAEENKVDWHTAYKILLKEKKIEDAKIV